MDASAMVSLAERWVNVPEQHVCESPADNSFRFIPKKQGEKLEVNVFSDGCLRSPNAIRFLEHVVCRLSIRHYPRGNLKIRYVYRIVNSFICNQSTDSFVIGWHHLLGRHRSYYSHVLGTSGYLLQIGLSCRFTFGERRQEERGYWNLSMTKTMLLSMVKRLN